MQFWIKGIASFFLRIINYLTQPRCLKLEEHQLTSAEISATCSITSTHSFFFQVWIS